MYRVSFSVNGLEAFTATLKTFAHALTAYHELCEWSIGLIPFTPTFPHVMRNYRDYLAKHNLNRTGDILFYSTTIDKQREKDETWWVICDPECDLEFEVGEVLTFG